VKGSILKIGDLVRFKQDVKGLENVYGVVVKKYEETALIQWANHPGGPGKGLREEHVGYLRCCCLDCKTSSQPFTQD
jgi:hypothetical protein|tara:strand:- start:878 stop:1108 length:231 start_codon:yes stop_codon:yes gene_type:complete